MPDLISNCLPCSHNMKENEMLYKTSQELCLEPRAAHIEQLFGVGSAATTALS